MSHSQTASSAHTATVKSYVMGFSLALALTLLAFALAYSQLVTGLAIVAVLLVLATIQTSAQLWFFLHLGREDRPHWNTIFLFNTISVILLIVIASIWIMNSLNNRMMSPADMQKYVIEEGAKGF